MKGRYDWAMGGVFSWTPRLFGLFITRTMFDVPELYIRLGRVSIHVTLHKKDNEGQPAR